MQSDTVRLLFTYGIATAVVVGGGLTLALTRHEVGSDDLRIIIAGFIGSALTFTFGAEVQARTARQAAAATQAAATAQAAIVANGNGPPDVPVHER